MICYLLDSSASTSGSSAWHMLLRPDGIFIGRLAKARLDQLCQGFTKNTMGRASSALFAEAVGALLSRYKDGYKELQTHGHLHACICRRVVHRH